MTDAQRAILKVEEFHRFLDKKAKDAQAKEMSEALGFVILLAKEHIQMGQFPIESGSDSSGTTFSEDVGDDKE